MGVERGEKSSVPSGLMVAVVVSMPFCFVLLLLCLCADAGAVEVEVDVDVEGLENKFRSSASSSSVFAGRWAWRFGCARGMSFWSRSESGFECKVAGIGEADVVDMPSWPRARAWARRSRRFDICLCGVGGCFERKNEDGTGR